MNIYVGNLPKETTEEELNQAFAAFGVIKTAAVIKDKYTGENRGFGFVEMDNKTEAAAAIAGMNGKDFKGRPLTVSEARPKSENKGGGGGFGGGRGGRGGSGAAGGRPKKAGGWRQW